MEIIYVILTILIFIIGYHFGVKAGQGNPVVLKKPRLKKPRVFISSSEDREQNAEIRAKQQEEELKNKLQ